MTEAQGCSAKTRIDKAIEGSTSEYARRKCLRSPVHPPTIKSTAPTPGEGWGGGFVEGAPLARTPTLALPRSTGGGERASRFPVSIRVFEISFSLAGQSEDRGACRQRSD